MKKMMGFKLWSVVAVLVLVFTAVGTVGAEDGYPYDDVILIGTWSDLLLDEPTLAAAKWIGYEVPFEWSWNLDGGWTPWELNTDPDNVYWVRFNAPHYPGVMLIGVRVRWYNHGAEVIHTEWKELPIYEDGTFLGDIVALSPWGGDVYTTISEFMVPRDNWTAEHFLGVFSDVDHYSLLGNMFLTVKPAGQKKVWFLVTSETSTGDIYDQEEHTVDSGKFIFVRVWDGWFQLINEVPYLSEYMFLPFILNK